MSSRLSRTFVGRVDELAHLSAALNDAANGRGRLVLLTGEAGIGKTRLCEELASLADARGVAVAWSACWEAGGVPPFWPWRQLLGRFDERALAGVFPAAGPEYARAEWFAAVTDALRAKAMDIPQLLVLDDAQWADAGSKLLLAHLAPILRRLPVLIVATVRQGESGPAALDAGLFRNAETLHLAGLTVDALSTLVTGLVGEAITEEVAIGLEGATGGNPLFAIELVRRLHCERRLDSLATTRLLPVSPTVRAALDELIADLSKPCRDVLAVASVLGREFSVDVLSEVAAVSYDQALDAIGEATKGGVLDLVSPDRAAFSHPLLLSVLYDDIGIARRVRLHAMIGDAYEARAAAGGRIDLATVSHHYLSLRLNLGSTCGRSL